MGVEYELKFRATVQQQAAIRAEIQGTEQEFDMETTYYDAPDESLSQRYYTLRKRKENGTSVCTLKTPNLGAGRGEWEVSCDRIEDAVEELCKLGAPQELKIFTAQGVQEVCGAKFHRIAKTVHLLDGVLELALDVGVLTGGGKEIPLCEVEVELKEGTIEMTRTYAMILAARYGLVPEKGSKFRRALALAKEDQ